MIAHRLTTLKKCSRILQLRKGKIKSVSKFKEQSINLRDTMFDLKIGVIGCGYWGKNLIRNFYQLNVLKYVCDKKKKNAEDISKKYGVFSKSINEIFKISDLDGIVIATPAENHFDLAKKALETDKHVFVEKPLSQVNEAKRTI